MVSLWPSLTPICMQIISTVADNNHRMLLTFLSDFEAPEPVHPVVYSPYESNIWNHAIKMRNHYWLYRLQWMHTIRSAHLQHASMILLCWLTHKTIKSASVYRSHNDRIQKGVRYEGGKEDSTWLPALSGAPWIKYVTESYTSARGTRFECASEASAGPLTSRHTPVLSQHRVR